MFSQVKENSGRIISKMNMDMVIEKGMLITNMIEKNKREWYASKHFISCRMDAARYAIEESFTPIEKETLH